MHTYKCTLAVKIDWTSLSLPTFKISLMLRLLNENMVHKCQYCQMIRGIKGNLNKICDTYTDYS